MSANETKPPHPIWGESGTPLAYWIDRFTPLHGQPLAKQKARMGREIKEILADRALANPLFLRAALDVMAVREAEPSSLSTYVTKAQMLASPTGQQRILIQGLLEQHKGMWPTGARFVHGTHAGTYVYDPLGYDRVPGHYDTRGSGIHRPSREEVVETLCATVPPSEPLADVVDHMSAEDAPEDSGQMELA